MIQLSVTPNLDEKPWDDLKSKEIKYGLIERVGLLPEAMASGDPSFALVGKLEDGTTVVLQTSWRTMHTALRALDVSPIAPKLRNIL